jgi:hypothetical protein
MKQTMINSTFRRALIAALLGLCAIATPASAQAAHSVTLNWSWTQGSGTLATGFQLQRGTVSGGPYAAIGSVAGATTLVYADASAVGNVLVEGQSYCYVVIAVNGSAAAPPSPEKCGVIPFTAPNAATGLTLTIK